MQSLNKFSGLFENIGEPAIKEIKKKVLKVIQSATFEGIQEAGQQIISNINTAKEDLWEGVFESLGIGALIGGGAMGVEISTGVDIAPTTEVTGGGKPTQQPSGVGGNVDTEVIEDKDKVRQESDVAQKVEQNLNNLEIEVNDINKAVETIREYMESPTRAEGSKFITTQAVETLRGTGVAEMKFDENDNIILYREGVITPGEPNSFSLEKRFDNQKPYKISKDEIAINTTSTELQKTLQ